VSIKALPLNVGEKNMKNCTFEQLGSYPTAIVHAPRLSLDFNNTLYIKREDQNHPVLGGSKIRKLEYLIPRCMSKRRIFTVGAMGSNTHLYFGMFKDRFGYDVEAYLYSKVRRDQAKKGHAACDEIRETFAVSAIFHNKHFVFSSWSSLLITLGMRYLYWGLKDRNFPYVVPLGATNLSTAFGYIALCAELQEQIEQGFCAMPDLIVAPLGTGGLLSGILAGVVSLGLPSKVIGVSIGKEPYPRKRLVTMAQRLLDRSFRQTGRQQRVSIPEEQCAVYHHPDLPPYAVTSPALEEFKTYLYDRTGIRFDSLYSAKAMWGCREYLKERGYAGKKVLFIHTWGMYRNTIPRYDLPTEDMVKS